MADSVAPAEVAISRASSPDRVEKRADLPHTSGGRNDRAVHAQERGRSRKRPFMAVVSLFSTAATPLHSMLLLVFMLDTFFLTLGCRCTGSCTGAEGRARQRVSLLRDGICGAHLLTCAWVFSMRTSICRILAEVPCTAYSSRAATVTVTSECS